MPLHIIRRPLTTMAIALLAGCGGLTEPDGARSDAGWAAASVDDGRYTIKSQNSQL